MYALRVGISEGVAGGRDIFYGENLVHFQVLTNPEHRLSQANLHGFLALDAVWTYPEPGAEELPAQRLILDNQAA